MEITHADITKASKILNYDPQIAIDDGLRETYKWHITQME